MRRFSLRTRLVLTVVGLLVLGLGLSVGATFGALQDWRARQSDDLLSIAGQEIDARLATGGAEPGAAPTLRAAVGEMAALWQTLAERGEVPAFFQLRDAAGRVRETVAFGPGPTIPDPLPAGLLPVAASSDNPAGARFVRVPGAVSPDGDEPAGWRLRSARLPGTTDQVLLVAQRSAISDELIGRTANVAIVTSVAVLVGITLLSGYLVRRGLRPLEDIGSTATAIGAGDLTRRIHDTTERTEVGRLGRALNAMLGQLEDAFRERARSEERLRRFVADASHELRTPIATVRGYAELFRRGAAQRPADLADAMHRIEVEATRMGELVDEMLLLARLDQGSPLEREPVDLGALVEGAVGDARAVEPDRPIELDVAGDTVVVGDTSQLRQVVVNLLGNVRAHTPPGAPAAVRVVGTGDAVELEVTDSGPGLSEPDRQRVFERFYQAGTHRTHSGAGLGLAILVAVVAAHDGAVTVLPAASGGCRFVVHIPRGDTTARSEPRASGPPAGTDHANGRR